MTRAAFLAAYRLELLAEYGAGTEYPWALDPERLASFLRVVEDAITSGVRRWAWDQPCARRAWRKIGKPGRLTWTGLVALPAGEPGTVQP